MLTCTPMSPGKHQLKDSMNSLRFSQPATFMRLPYLPDPKDVDITVTGIAHDGTGQIMALLAANLLFEFISSR